MSEQDIHSTLPTGSPILAYGTGPRTSRARTILAITAGIFVALVVLLIFGLRTHVQMPKRIAALAVVRGGTPLPDGTPTVWRQAVAHSSLPVILGLAMDAQGAQPFAVAVSSPVRAGFAHTDSGALSVLFDTHAGDLETWQLSQLVSFSVHTLSSPAYLRFQASAIDPSFESTAEGPIDAHGIWHTDTRLQGDGSALPNGDFALNLAAFPEAWPFVQQLSSQTAALSGRLDAPEAISWYETTSTTPNMLLQYAQDPSTSTLLVLAGAAGISEQVPYRLHDDVIAHELRLPTELLNSTSSAPLATSTTVLTISGRRVSLRPVELNSIQQADVSGCETGDQAVFHLSHDYLEGIRQHDGWQFIGQADGLTLSVHQGRLEVCIQP